MWAGNGRQEEECDVLAVLMKRNGFVEGHKEKETETEPEQLADSIAGSVLRQG